MSNLGISVGIEHPRSKFYNVSDHVASKDNWMLGLLLDTRCQTREINEKIFTQTANYRHYEKIHIWLILASNLKEITQLLNDSSYSSHTDLVIAVDSHNGYELHDVYNPSKMHGGTLNITKMGFWDPTNGLNVTLTQSKFHRRKNLHGMPIKIGAVAKYQPPGMTMEAHLQDTRKKWEDVITKYGYSIIRHLADIYNFTLDIIKFTETITTINGTEVGLMAKLSKGKFDLTATLVSANVRFAPYGHLAMPGYPYRSFFVFRSSIKTLKWTEFVAPFSVGSWLAIGCTAILASAIITRIQMTEHQDGWFAESGHALFVTVGVLCQQGLVVVPKRLAGRIALLFLLVFGLLVFNYYSASVVSARLSQPLDKMNDSLYSLANSHIKVGSEPFFMIDDNLNSRSLYDWEARFFNEKVWKKLSKSRYEQVEEGLKKVADGGYAYHTSAEVAYPYIDEHWDDTAICEMTEVHVMKPRTMTFYERANSPFTEMIRIGLLKASIMGLQKRTAKRWKPKIPYCSPLARSLQRISIFETAPAIMMMMIGSTLAILVLLIEKILHKIHPPSLEDVGEPKMQRSGGN